MTDSQKFTLIEKTKKDIQKMGFSIEIFHNKSIQIGSDNFTVIFEKDNFKVFNNTNVKALTMNQEQWEEYSAEVDNLERAILWINTQIKSIVFES